MLERPKRIAAFLFAALVAHGQGLGELYQRNDWFRLRDAVLGYKSAPVFLRGSVELAFGDWKRAEKDLRAAESSAGPSQAGLAMAELADLYSLLGRYKDAADQYDRFERFAAKAGVPEDGSRVLKAYGDLAAILKRYPDQAATRSYSRIPYAAGSDGQPMVPVTVEGKQVKLILDTGSSGNTISSAEANELGLEVRPVSVPLAAYGGAKADTQGVAVARQVSIGNSRIRNVAFFVVKDDATDGPGVLGLPVLFALGAIRWRTGEVIETGFDLPAPGAGEPNLAYHGGLGLITQAALGRDSVLLRVDTGTPETLVFPRFAALLGGDITRETLAHKGAGLRVGGFDAVLERAHLTPTDALADDDDPHGLDGNLGLDILEQGSTVTLDLIHMRLRID